MRYLYHTQPDLLQFNARVLSAVPAPGMPGHFDLTLSDTAFYPTGGGQPCDMGSIAGCPVVDVFAAREGDPPVHRVKAERPPEGGVTCMVDGARRFDHMQQHTGQHLLSHFLSRDYGAYSLGLHIGAQISYVDISGDTAPEMTQDLADDLMDKVNAWIARDDAVVCLFPSEEELKTLPLRKIPPAHEDLRIVVIGKEEAVACCGTHVRATGQVQAVFLTGWQKSHGNLRLFFAAGSRALAHARVRMDACESAAQKLSCHVSDLPGAVDKLIEGKAESARTIAALQKQIAQHALSAVRPIPCAQAILYAAQFPSPDAARDALPVLLANQHALALLTAPDAGGVFVAVGVSKGCAVHAGDVFKTLLAHFGGKGGGRPDSAFGRAPALDMQEAISLLKQHLS